MMLMILSTVTNVAKRFVPNAFCFAYMGALPSGSNARETEAGSRRSERLSGSELGEHK